MTRIEVEITPEPIERAIAEAVQAAAKPALAKAIDDAPERTGAGKAGIHIQALTPIKLEVQSRERYMYIQNTRTHFLDQQDIFADRLFAETRSRLQ